MADHPPDPAHDPGHFRRVWRLAREIAEAEGVWDQIDRLAVLAACYLHDIVNPPKDSPLRNKASRLSAEKACVLMEQRGTSQDTLDRMAHAIEAHSFSANIKAETVEARVVQDADRLEAIGAIGIARVFAVSGALGRNLFDPDDLFAERRERDDTKFSVDHFETKLFRIPERMATETGRRLATERAEYMRGYLRELARDLGNPVEV